MKFLYKRRVAKNSENIQNMKFTAILVFATFFAFTSSAPTPAANDVEEPMVKKTEQMLTVEAFDGYIGLLKMFKDMLPLDIITTIDNVSFHGKKLDVR